jgi:hypothetical protein
VSVHVFNDGMWTRRVAIVLAVAVLGYGIACCFGLVNVPFGPLIVKRMDPEWIFFPEGGDPLVVRVGFTWPEDGQCLGQFRVSFDESATRIRVGTVVSRQVFGPCAGVGTLNNKAWTDLRLSSPPGDRTFVRDRDGARLPIVDSAFIRGPVRRAA